MDQSFPYSVQRKHYGCTYLALSLFETRQLISYLCKETTKETLISFLPPMHWRNPNNPTSVGTIWPPYTADSEEYLGLSPNLTVTSKMRLDKMAFWNELVPSFEETIKPTETSHIPTTTQQRDDKKGVFMWNLTLVFLVLSGQRWIWEGDVPPTDLPWPLFPSLFRATTRASQLR